MKKLFERGAQWLRIDFHLHTRTDSLKHFVYSGEDNSFISDYVKTLKQKGIAIGAITNHNIFDLGEFKALRKKSFLLSLKYEFLAISSSV